MTIKLRWKNPDNPKGAVVRTFKKPEGAVKFLAEHPDAEVLEGQELLPTPCEWTPDTDPQVHVEPPHPPGCANCDQWRVLCECARCREGAANEEDWTGGDPVTTEAERVRAHDAALREEATQEVAERETNATGRRVKFGSDWIVRVLVPNPKKPGSKAHARFALYKDGGTVEENLAAGVQRIDLAWDSDRNHVRVVNPRLDEEG